MIGAFPDLYPDEMLVSGLARYEAWVRYPNRRALLDELFGNEKTPVAFDIPGRLGFLVAALPLEHSAGAVEELLAEHTLFPYYAAFLPQAHQKSVSKRLHHEPGGQLYGQIGLGGRRSLQLPQFWRYCPVCVAADRTTFGETYWHRVHQAAGVEVCPHHAVWLKTSEIPMWMVPGAVTFATAESVVNDSDGRAVNLLRPVERQLLRLARAVLWLLEHPDMNAEVLELKPRATLWLAEQGLSTYSGRLKQSQIADAFMEVYPNDMLVQIDCVLDGDKGRTTWLQYLLQDHNRSMFALHALLLALFCTEDIPEFLALPAELKPFGDGPWPCLNPTCDHHETCISGCALDFDSKGFPRGTFGCEVCGFVYTRVGPDVDQNQQFQIGSIRQRGAVWEERLREVWLNPNMNMKQMLKALESSWGYLRQVGTRLGLPFPPPGVRARKRTSTPASPGQPDTPVDVSSRREEWLTILRENPNSATVALRKEHARLYSWLRYHDREWLSQHTPQKQRQPTNTRQVDWAQRDMELMAGVEQAYDDLMAKQPPLFRVSKTALLTTMRQRRHYDKKNRERLPGFFNAVMDHAESYEDFAIRRVWHIARGLHERGYMVRRRELAERVSVDGPPHRDNPRVQAAVDEAHAWLKGDPWDNFIPGDATPDERGK